MLDSPASESASESPSEPASASPGPLQPLVEAGAHLIRSKLAEEPLSPHVFDEISVAAKAIHKACTALDPILNLPDPARTTPLAPSPQTEGYGATMARELIGAFQNMGMGAAQNSSPRLSRKDLMGAIVVAEKAGFTDDAERLRTELFGEDTEEDDDLLPPARKVELANKLLQESDANTHRAKALLASINPEQIIDDEPAADGMLTKDSPAPA